MNLWSPKIKLPADIQWREDAWNKAEDSKKEEDMPSTQEKKPGTPSQRVSASRKKLVKSPSSLFTKKKKASKDTCQQVRRAVILEKESVSPALESAVVCRHCLSGPVTFQEDKTKAVGLYCCKACSEVTVIFKQSIINQS